MRVLIAGGGTAGHVFPGLALAGVLRERGHEVSFVGTEGGLEGRLVPEAGFPLHVVPAAPLLRKLSFTTVKAPIVAAASVARCRPLAAASDVVVGMGGYVSVSSVLAARRERRPTVLHEQNAIPGVANRTLARLARVVALSFADAKRFFPARARTVLTGNPVREEIRRVPEEREALAKEARTGLDLDPSRRTLVIFGGSQGALHLDRAAVGLCSLLRARADLQVVLITGPAHIDLIRRALANDDVAAGSPGRSDGLRVRVFPYVERMDLVYSVADLVVARAGATTMAELTACGLPALLVPYPYATANHQEANARALQRTGGASLLLDEQVTAESLTERVESLLDYSERLRAMAQRSKAFGRPDAGERLADLVLEKGRAA